MQKVFATVQISSPFPLVSLFATNLLICSSKQVCNHRGQFCGLWDARLALVAKAGGASTPNFNTQLLSRLQPPALLAAWWRQRDAEPSSAFPSWEGRWVSWHPLHARYLQAINNARGEALQRCHLSSYFDLTWDGNSASFCSGEKSIQWKMFFPTMLLFKAALSLEREIIKKEKQLMASVGQDITGKFSCQAWKFWLNLAKSF